MLCIRPAAAMAESPTEPHANGVEESTPAEAPIPTYSEAFPALPTSARPKVVASAAPAVRSSTIQEV